jgi:hypothetical protein
MNDPAIDEIRRIRHEISREAGHDLRNLKRTFAMLETQFQRPSVDFGGRRTIPLTETATQAVSPTVISSPSLGDR